MLDSCEPITQLNKRKYPTELIFFDTESYVESKATEIDHHKFRLGVAIYVSLDKNLEIKNREVYYFKTTKEFWYYVDKKANVNKVLHIYAHNAKYDTLNVNIIDELNELGYTIPFPTIDNAFIISAHKNRKKIKIVDTFNYVRLSIEKIGEKIGINKIELPKLKNEIDFNSLSDAILFPYCENDTRIVEGLILSLIKFLNENKLGSLKYTTSSTALDIYRHSFITTPIYYHTNDNVLFLERSAYRGGLVECFKLGKLPKEKYYLLDINSMYVSVMVNNKLPLYPVTYVSNPSLKDLKNSIKNNYIIADVIIDIKDKSNYGKYGVKHENKLIFPIGKFRVSLHYPELLHAIQDKIIIKVFSYTVYYADYCLRDYALYFSELKKKYKSGTVDYEFTKLLGNGLYGKFGMRKYDTDKLNIDELLGDELMHILYNDNELENILEIKQKEKLKKDNKYVIRKKTKAKECDQSSKREPSGTDEINKTENNNTGMVRDDGKEIRKTITEQETTRLKNGRTQIIRVNGQLYYKWNNEYIRSFTDELKHTPRTNVALAGAVTAYARCLIYSYINIANPVNCYYSDTDSIMVNEKGYNNLKNKIDDKELGLLKCEFEFNKGYIKAPKNYIFVLLKKLTPIKIKKIKIEIEKTTNIIHKKKKSIILKKRERSKGIPKGAINKDGIFEYWRFTTFKEYLLSKGDLKGRTKRKRKNTLKYSKGYAPLNNSNETRPYIMDYSEEKEINIIKDIECQQKTNNKKMNSKKIKTLIR